MDTDSYDSSEDEYRSDWHSNGDKTYPNTPKQPRFRIVIPQLKYMASAVVAISLWNHLNIPRELSSLREHCVKKSYLWRRLKDDVCNLTSVLPVPRPMVEQINTLIGEIHDRIANWATYHFRTVFLNSVQDNTVYHLVHHIVWRTNGSIDNIETAKNISKSKSPRLNDIEKYRFLCTYCLKDEIQDISPIILLDIIQDYVFFDEHPLIRYWNCFFRNELHLIPKNENKSLDCFMFQHRLVDNWPAKEYFFDRLMPEEQVQVTISLIDQSGLLYQKALLKLNESQRISVYMARSQQIISNYIRSKGNSKDILRTWFDIRHLITEEQLVKIFDNLLEAKTVPVVLTRIWCTADAHLKQHLLNYNNYKFIEKILYSYEEEHDHNFVFAVFQDLDEDMKYHILKNDYMFKSFCEKLFSKYNHLPLLDRLSNLLLTDRNLSKRFKQYFMLNLYSIRKHCSEYYSTVDVKGLNDLLTHHLSEDPDFVPKYKKYLLESEEGMAKCAHLLNPETDNLRELIVDALGADADLQEEFIKKLFNSYETFKRFRDLLANNNLNDVKIIVDRYLTSNEDKKKFKRTLIDEQYYLMCHIFVKYGEFYFESVLWWRFSEEKGASIKEWMARIQTIIPIKEIFDGILYENITGEGNYEDLFFLFSVRRNFNSSCFDSLNRVLNWYFKLPSDVKQYKLCRIYSYEKVPMIVKLLERERYDSHRHIKVLITWFFENDRKEIEKFKKRCNKNRKMQEIMEDI